jgi:hypothetical protein
MSSSSLNVVGLNCDTTTVCLYHLEDRRALPYVLLQTLPVLVGGMFWLIVSFIIQTGAKNDTWADRGGADIDTKQIEQRCLLSNAPAVLSMRRTAARDLRCTKQQPVFTHELPACNAQMALPHMLAPSSEPRPSSSPWLSSCHYYGAASSPPLMLLTSEGLLRTSMVVS